MKSIPAEEVRQICIDGRQCTPDPNPIPNWEGGRGDVGKDHSSDLVSELKSPGAEEGNKRRRIDDPGVVVLRVREPRHLDRSADNEREKQQDWVMSCPSAGRVRAGCCYDVHITGRGVLVSIV